MNKQYNMNPDILSLSHVGLSLLGLSLLAVLTFKDPTSGNDLKVSKQFISLIYAAICLFGIIVGICPSRCSRTLHLRSYTQTVTQMEQNQKVKRTIRFVGHHPTCGKFSAHLIRFRSRIFCAGCTGLVTGAIIALLASLLYSILDFYSRGTSVFIFWIGFAAVVCGLLQCKNLDWDRGSVHFFLNVTFVLGTFLLLVGVTEITSNVIVEFYLFTLMIYWIITRILTSQVKHRKICTTCGSQSCDYLTSQ